MFICPGNVWNAGLLRAGFNEAARTRAASLILAGANPRLIDLDALVRDAMEAWLQAALPAGCA